MDCSFQHSSVHGVLQAQILEWVAMPSSRGSSRPRGRTCVSCIGRQVLVPLGRTPGPFPQHHLGSSTLRWQRERSKWLWEGRKVQRACASQPCKGATLYLLLYLLWTQTLLASLGLIIAFWSRETSTCSLKLLDSWVFKGPEVTLAQSAISDHVVICCEPSRDCIGTSKSECLHPFIRPRCPSCRPGNFSPCRGMPYDLCKWVCSQL